MIAPNPALQALADQYCREHHWAKPVRGHYVLIDPPLARIIAAEYALLPRFDASAITLRCYTALLKQVIAQFVFLIQAGYCIEQWPHTDQPYHTCEMLCTDVRENRHLYVFSGGELHPLLGEQVLTMCGISWSGNAVFRAVHDLFGHVCEGYDFSERGEENAWIHQSMLLSSLAQWALTTETRGQNRWHYHAPTHAGMPVSLKTFAPQKAALLPVTMTLLPVSILEQWTL